MIVEIYSIFQVLNDVFDDPRDELGHSRVKLGSKVSVAEVEKCRQQLSVLDDASRQLLAVLSDSVRD